MTRKEEIILGVSGAAFAGVALYFYNRNKTIQSATAQSYPAGSTIYQLNSTGTATSPTVDPQPIYNTVNRQNFFTIEGPTGTNPHNAFVPLSNGNVMLYDQFGVSDELTLAEARQLGYTGPA